MLADDPRGYTMEVSPQNLTLVAVGQVVPKKAIAITQTSYATFYERCYHNLVGGPFQGRGVPGRGAMTHPQLEAVSTWVAR